jgi:hypothetical protein
VFDPALFDPDEAAAVVAGYAGLLVLGADTPARAAGRLREALGRLDWAERLGFPGRATALRRADALTRLGDPAADAARGQARARLPAATRALAAALRADPDHFAARYLLALCYTQTGATDETYTVAARTSDSGHQFRALATVGTKTTTSPAAALTVRDPPALTSSPGNQTAAVGGSATFTAGAVGIGMKTQWQVSTDGGKTFSTIRGATKSTLTLKKLAAGVYVVRAVFTNAVGITQFASATLTVA